MDISRRAALGAGCGALVSAVGFRAVGSTVAAPTARTVAAPAVVGVKELNARTLSLNGYNTRERLDRVTYWADGKYIPEALAAINKAMRDWRTGEEHVIEPKLIDLIYHLGRMLDTACQFELISGYRSAKTNAFLHSFDKEVAVNSLHLQGQAADISLPARPLAKLHEAALSMKVGGVGFYPKSNFIHVDVGRVRRWVG